MKKVILAPLALLIITILGCSKEKEQEKPPYPKGDASFKGEVLFNGTKLNGIGNGAAYISFWRNSSDTVSVGFSDYAYNADDNQWYPIGNLGLSYAQIPIDSVQFIDSRNNLALYTTYLSYTEMAGDALAPTWQSDSGSYSLHVNPDSSITIDLHARLLDGAGSERGGFSRDDTLYISIKGKFIPR